MAPVITEARFILMPSAQTMAAAADNDQDHSQRKDKTAEKSRNTPRKIPSSRQDDRHKYCTGRDEGTCEHAEHQEWSAPNHGASC